MAIKTTVEKSIDPSNRQSQLASLQQVPYPLLSHRSLQIHHKMLSRMNEVESMYGRQHTQPDTKIATFSQFSVAVFELFERAMGYLVQVCLFFLSLSPSLRAQSAVDTKSNEAVRMRLTESLIQQNQLIADLQHVRADHTCTSVLLPHRLLVS